MRVTKDLKTRRKEKKFSNLLKDYFGNRLNEEEEIRLFQELIDSGTIGEYGDKLTRLATTFVEKGLCTNA